MESNIIKLYSPAFTSANQLIAKSMASLTDSEDNGIEGLLCTREFDIDYAPVRGKLRKSSKLIYHSCIFCLQEQKIDRSCSYVLCWE